MGKSEPKVFGKWELTTFAAVIVSVASVFATLSWVTSSLASGTSNDYKTKVLQTMLNKMDDISMASNTNAMINTYDTLENMYSLQAMQENENMALKLYFEDMARQYGMQSTAQMQMAESLHNKIMGYGTQIDQYLSQAGSYSTISTVRTIAGTLFAVSSLIGATVLLLKRKGILLLILPLWVVAFALFAASFLGVL